MAGACWTKRIPAVGGGPGGAAAMDHLAWVAAEAEVLNVYKERSEPDMEMKIVEETKGNDQHEHEVHAAAMGIPRGFFGNAGRGIGGCDALDRISGTPDPWLGGLSVAAVAPAVLALVRPALIKRRKVSEGLPNNEWVNDIAGELSVDTVVQFFKLWDAVSRISLGKSADSFTWKWTADGSFSSRSAYRGFFHGTTALPGSAQVWNSFAPYKFKFHAWLALRGRCWTADRRLCHGLPSHTLPAVFGGG
ncbi:hypothetical protein ACQ4PT_005410 [Festuca glaucescens]